MMNTRPFKGVQACMGISNPQRDTSPTRPIYNGLPKPIASMYSDVLL